MQLENTAHKYKDITTNYETMIINILKLNDLI